MSSALLQGATSLQSRLAYGQRAETTGFRYMLLSEYLSVSIHCSNITCALALLHPAWMPKIRRPWPRPPATRPHLCDDLSSQARGSNGWQGDGRGNTPIGQERRPRQAADPRRSAGLPEAAHHRACPPGQSQHRDRGADPPRIRGRLSQGPGVGLAIMGRREVAFGLLRYALSRFGLPDDSASYRADSARFRRGRCVRARARYRAAGCNPGAARAQRRSRQAVTLPAETPAQRHEYFPYLGRVHQALS